MLSSHMVKIEFAKSQDVPVILDFIKALAEYEKLSHEVVATEEKLRATLFGRKPAAEVILLRDGNETAGFALFFHNYSTFLAKPGIYLEDLFVKPAFRGRGHGKALLAALAKIAVERACGRLEWSVLDWNKPAIDLYLSLGSKPQSEWTVHRMTGDALRALASR